MFSGRPTSATVLRSPSRSSAASVSASNQAILQNRLNKIDAEFEQIHSVLQGSAAAAGDRPTRSPSSAFHSSFRTESSQQRHRDRMSRATAALSSTAGGGSFPRASLTRIRSVSPTSFHRSLSAAELTSPLKTTTSTSRSQHQQVYSPAAQAKSAAASAISSPVRAATSVFVTSPTRVFASASPSALDMYPTSSLTQPFTQPNSSLAPLPPVMPPSSANAATSQSQLSLAASLAANPHSASASTPYVLSQNFPGNFVVTMNARDRRIDSYLDEYLRESSYRLQKLKSKILLIQQNADEYISLHDVELTGLKRDQLVEQVNYEIALLEKNYRRERMEAEEKLALFLQAEKEERVASFRQVLQSEGEESIERIRNEYLTSRNDAIEALRQDITRKRDEEINRVRNQSERETEKQMKEYERIYLKDSSARIDEEKLILQQQETSAIQDMKKELEKQTESEMALLREKFQRSTALRMQEEEEAFQSARRSEFSQFKQEILERFSLRLQEKTSELDLHQKRSMHELEMDHSRQYEHEAEALSRKYAEKLQELQKKASEDFKQTKELKLKALEFKLIEEMKSSLSTQMTSLKNEFLTTREEVKSKLEAELQERHAYELDLYRTQLLKERADELEARTQELKSQSDRELVEVTHEFNSEKQRLLDDIHARFEKERSEWLMKLQAAYEVDKAIAQDNLIKQYEAEKILSITDLRVTLANRKQAALESIANQYETEKNLKLRGLNHTLSQLSVNAANDKDVAMLQRQLGSSSGSSNSLSSLHSSSLSTAANVSSSSSLINGAGGDQVDKFQTLAQKIQKLQAENNSLKGAQECSTCNMLLAKSQDGTLSKHAREQYAFQRQQHMRESHH